MLKEDLRHMYTLKDEQEEMSPCRRNMPRRMSTGCL